MDTGAIIGLSVGIGVWICYLITMVCVCTCLSYGMMGITLGGGVGCTGGLSVTSAFLHRLKRSLRNCSCGSCCSSTTHERPQLQSYSEMVNRLRDPETGELPPDLEDSSLEGEPEDEPRCPITQRRVSHLSDPVVFTEDFNDPNIYERANLLDWLNQHRTSPISRTPIPEDHDISFYIKRWVKEKPAKPEESAEVDEATIGPTLS